ncbi:ovomucoid-like [Antechinus flavipes]|uniref:ovomucoid-like n=1 Tax=Antechinus flavipes TaxID=38775 RepID=UPI002235E5FA|nr:ovomucoid-like [Antechinus flavipes]
MKPAAVCRFLMLSLVIILTAELSSGDTIDCSRYKKLPPGEFPACTGEFLLICGSNGRTYINKCNFCHAVKQSDDNIKFVHWGTCKYQHQI